MPRFVWRVGYGWGVAFLVLASAGIGVSLLSTSWRRDHDDQTRIATAYAGGDFRLAAELARRRLKGAPDDKEALRLLARATARLGRDAPANALFARLGSAALQAEDLYLLGLGLDRAGQKEEAGRIWETGLALQPDHAEMMGQLIITLTAQSRPAEAAHLAERLARQPGWELRGELDLGTFRAEMNDPAGAAAVLRQALDRPEASRLDLPTITHYRRLLARSLLKIKHPGDARLVLREVLEHGRDPEASWLLSRAALQEGAIGEAVTALAGAGSYRAEHPLDLEPSSYVGESRCVQCHSDKVRAFQASRHNSTLVREPLLAELPYPDRIVPDPDDPTVTHAFKREGGQVHVETRVKDKILNAVVDYAFGSPRHYCSLVGHDDLGNPYIFRLSHYQDGLDSGWVRTTGHSPDAHAGQNFLGKPIEGVDGVYKCLFCHTTDPRAVLDRSGPAAADRAIGCERCHGPAGNHILAIEAKLTDPAIVNPALATAEGRLRVCGQCHSNHQQSPLPRTDLFWLRFQGNTIAWSRCYTESGGSLDCMTCHDAHHDNDQSAAQHNARCLTCHSTQTPETTIARSGTSNPQTGRPVHSSACPVNPADGCIGCHMPSVRMEPLHASFTDHYIRVYPASKPAASP